MPDADVSTASLAFLVLGASAVAVWSRNRLAGVAKLGKNLGQAVEAYNGTVATLESRVLVTGRKFADLGKLCTGRPGSVGPPAGRRYAGGDGEGAPWCWARLSEVGAGRLGRPAGGSTGRWSETRNVRSLRFVRPG